MTLRGSVADAALVDVLQLLARQAKSGVLRAVDGARDVHLAIERGSVVSAVARDRASSEVVLRWLVRAGSVSPSVGQRALGTPGARASALRLGQTLVRDFGARVEAVQDALRRDLREITLDLFLWSRGQVAFTVEPVPVPDFGPLPLRLDGLVLDGLSLRHEWAHIEAAQPAAAALLYRAKALPEPIDALDLAFMADNSGASIPPSTVDDDERAVFEAVDEGQPYAALLESSPLDHFSTRRAVVSLVEQGFLRQGQSALVDDLGWAELGVRMSEGPGEGIALPPGFTSMGPSESCALGRRVLARREDVGDHVRLVLVSSNEGVEAAFEQIMALASRCRGKQTCAVLDFGKAQDGGLYFATEAIAGPSLTQWRSDAAAATGVDLLELCILAVQGVRCVHSQGILHNRICEHSFQVVPSRGVVLADLAEALLLAVVPASEGEDPSWRYGSPERLLRGPVDARSDVYALGALVYELFCGVPHHGATRPEARPPRSTPPSWREVAPALVAPPGVEMVVQRCLFAEPERRYQDLGALQSALETILVYEREDGA